jgi:hypothetical protein
MVGTSAWIDPESAALADLLQEHYEALPGQVGRVSRSAVIRAALWALVRETPGLVEAEVRAEVAQRMEAG